MPDCSAMQITIGGPLCRAALPQLVATILEESVGPDWDAPFGDQEEAISHIETTAAQGEPLVLAQRPGRARVRGAADPAARRTSPPLRHGAGWPARRG